VYIHSYGGAGTPLSTSKVNFPSNRSKVLVVTLYNTREIWFAVDLFGPGLLVELFEPVYVWKGAKFFLLVVMLPTGSGLMEWLAFY
jgi:hypothetical protein